MSFIKGFIVTLVLYIGLSIIFPILILVMAELPIDTLFSDAEAISRLFYTNLVIPVVTESVTLIRGMSILYDNILLVQLLGYIVPVALSAIIGSLVAKKAGRVLKIFGASFSALMICLLIGVILQVSNWPAGNLFIGTTEFYRDWQWFLPTGILMGMFNAAIWCSFGLLLTRKKWD